MHRPARAVIFANAFFPLSVVTRKVRGLPEEVSALTNWPFEKSEPGESSSVQPFCFKTSISEAYASGEVKNPAKTIAKAICQVLTRELCAATPPQILASLVD
jgi:hypothetical protein